MELVAVEHRTEQSDTVEDKLHDNAVDEARVLVAFWVSEFLWSLGSLGFSLLPGVLGSFGLLPDPLPPISPPPPGGQNGHIHEGPWIPNPPVPPFHH